MQCERWSQGARSAGLALAFACLLWPSVLAADAAPEEALPDPEAPGSHEAYLERLSRARTESFEQLLAHYDEWLTANPDDIVVALERCRFVLSFAASDEELDGPAAVSEDCVEELAQRYPDTPAVLHFRSEQLWGEQAIAFGLAAAARKDVPWTLVEHAALLKQLAYAYFNEGKQEDASRWALQARAWDARADVGLILATHWLERGVQHDAIVAELVHGPCEGRYAQRRVEMLIELEAFARALELIEACRAKNVTIADWSHAQALAGAGRKPAARAKYAELAGNGWMRERALRETLYLDLDGGDLARAVASYAALRDRGFEADPFLRHRLALLVAFPGAPWALRDALGLLALIALGACFALMPGLIVLPVHYIGLVRRARGAPIATGDRWSLGQLWLVLAALALAELVGWHLFAYPDLHGLFFESAVQTHQRDVDIARSLLVTFVLSAAGVLMWMRRGDYVRVVRSTWSPARIAGVVLACLFLVNVLHRLSKLIASAAGLTDGEGDAFGVELTTLEMLRVFNGMYGSWVLLLMVAVLVPVYEEIAFRGVFLGAAARYLPFGWANVLQAAAFTVAHDEPVRYVGLFTFGLLAGVIARRSGGIAPAIALHAAMNALVAIGIIVTTSGGRAPPLGAYFEAIDPTGLAKSCQSGNGEACFALGQRHRWGRGVRQDWVSASRLFDQGCQHGFAQACHELGNLYYDGNAAIRQDFTRAAPLFERACSAGFMHGCAALGMAYRTGRGVPQDVAAGARLSRRACSGGHAAACSHLGFDYASGEGVPLNAGLSARFFRRGCDGGNMYGCVELGTCHARGQGTELNLEAAAALYGRACDGNAALGCVHLASMFAAGAGVVRDPQRADELSRKACDLGHTQACPAQQRTTPSEAD